MDEEQGDLLLGRVFQFIGFCLSVIEGDDDGAQRLMIVIPFKGETEHIGGFVDLTVGAVELSYCRIVTEDELDVPTRAGIGDGLQVGSFEVKFCGIF